MNPDPMIRSLNQKKWVIYKGGEDWAFRYDHAVTAHADVFRCADGKIRVFSMKTCHYGIVVETPEQADAAERWLRKQHAKNRKLCDC